MGRCGLVSAMLRLLWPDRAAKLRKYCQKGDYPGVRSVRRVAKDKAKFRFFMGKKF
jgi:hypothetical protein